MLAIYFLRACFVTDRILTRIDYRVANILIKQAYKLEVDCIGYSFCLIKHYYFLSVIHIKKGESRNNYEKHKNDH